MTDIVDRLNDSLSAGYSELRKEAAAEITRLRARIEAMERQEPVARMDESVRKAWARFSNAIVSGDDAPYPGMSEAFERHFSQSFTDREWRTESATWAAAWKAAKRHEAQAQPAPSVPEGWLRAVDEALVVAHIGVANESDAYEEAKAKLDSLIGFHIDVATDPAVNGGYKLMPIEPTHETLMVIVGVVTAPLSFREVRAIYDAMLAAAPEAKP